MLAPIRHHRPERPSNTKTYLKLTMFTVAPSGWFPPHLHVSSDMVGRRILTCITSDLLRTLPHTVIINHHTPDATPGMEGEDGMWSTLCQAVIPLSLSIHLSVLCIDGGAKWLLL